MWKNIPFMLHMYSIGIYAQQSYKLQMKSYLYQNPLLNAPQSKQSFPTTVIQAVVVGDLSSTVHCSVTTLSTIDGQWDNENTFINYVIHFNFLNSHQILSVSLQVSHNMFMFYTDTNTVWCLPIHRGTVWCTNILNIYM